MSKHKSRPFTDPRDTWHNRARQSAEAKTVKKQPLTRHRVEQVYQRLVGVGVDRALYSTWFSSGTSWTSSTRPVCDFSPGDHVEYLGSFYSVGRSEDWVGMGWVLELDGKIAYARDCKLVGGPW